MYFNFHNYSDNQEFLFYQKRFVLGIIITYRHLVLECLKVLIASYHFYELDKENFIMENIFIL